MLKIYQANFITLSCLFFFNISYAQVNTDTIPVLSSPIQDSVKIIQDSLNINDSLQSHVASITDTFPLPTDSSKALVIPAPQQNDTTPTSINIDLEQIFNSKTPKEYTIGDIKVTGSKSFDPGLVISISGLAVGDKLMLPGADNFSHAITNLWKQNLISDVEIYFTKLVDKNLSVEINVTERPRLSSFKFKGIKKGEADELDPKTGLVKGRVVTENMKRTAVDNIKKFYVDKGFRNAPGRCN